MNINAMNLLMDAAATGAAEEMSLGASIIYWGVQIVPMVLIFVVFWFFLIRPQRKKEKEAQDMLKALKVGDRICTIGGIYGTICNIKDDVLTIEVGSAKTQLVMARWAIKNIDTSSAENDAEALV